MKNNSTLIKYVSKTGKVNHTYSDKERIACYNYKFRENNFERYILGQIKSYSAKKGLEFNLTIEDIKIPCKCPYLGITITKYLGKGIVDSNPSVDRNDITKGYIKENITIISTKANRVKKAMNIDELKLFANNILKNYKL